MRRATAFYADWTDASFLHFRVSPALLQPSIPFALDLREGNAWVSLVAFTMEKMRPAWCDCALGEMLLRPFAPCRFLNVRTYVRTSEGDGIFFLGEWLSRWANVPLGPPCYGLPYRAGTLKFEGSFGAGRREVAVRGLSGKGLQFALQTLPDLKEDPELSHFLLERYLAFNSRGETRRLFAVSHQPWRRLPAQGRLTEGDLLWETGAWIESAECAGGHLSPGVRRVKMSWPWRMRGS